MTFRWFGENIDSVELWKIRQVPGVTGIITTLYEKAPGEVWSREEIRNLKNTVEKTGLTVAGIESVNIHDAIKVGTPEREQYIENYIETLKNLGEEGLDLVCYNFMPIFDWTRSDLAKVREDGATVLSYDQEIIDQINPDDMFGALSAKANGFMLPGWEPERMETIKELFELYRDIDEEALFANLVYFLEAIMPTCEQYGIRMAIHPDDPAWSVFNLPRIMKNQADFERLIATVPSVYNGVTFCTGSLGSNPDNDLYQIIEVLEGRIHFAHLRNIIYRGEKKFDEAAHLSSDGSLNMFRIVKKLIDTGFDGVVRPDHGRAIWGEVSMPGYGLYDRAIGASYLIGLWEAITEIQNEQERMVENALSQN